MILIQKYNTINIMIDEHVNNKNMAIEWKNDKIINEFGSSKLAKNMYYENTKVIKVKNM